MRGARAKQLRRMAEQNTVGQLAEDFGYVDRSNPLEGKTRYQKVTVPGTTKSEYNRLKNIYKASRSDNVIYHGR